MPMSSTRVLCPRVPWRMTTSAHEFHKGAVPLSSTRVLGPRVPRWMTAVPMSSTKTLGPGVPWWMTTYAHAFHEGAVASGFMEDGGWLRLANYRPERVAGGGCARRPCLAP